MIDANQMLKRIWTKIFYHLKNWNVKGENKSQKSFDKVRPALRHFLMIFSALKKPTVRLQCEIKAAIEHFSEKQ